MKPLHILQTALTSLALAGSALGAPTLTAELQPAEIALGQTARLLVKLSGGNTATRPSLPQVDGLRVEPAGQSSQIQILNGQMSSSLIFSYHLSADRVGEFEIPAITARHAGTTLRTEPMVLRVTASPHGVPNAPASPGSAPLPDPGSGAATDKLAFLRVERAENKGREHLYVGEMTPIAIRAYFLEGVQVNLTSKPSLADPAFTLRGLSEQPEQASTTLDGKRYRVLTWFAGLSGVKAGEHPVEATLEATIGIPQKSTRPRSRSRSPFGSSPFDDPFFDSVFDDFFARVDRREVTLSSEKQAVPVHALPMEGRPPHFEGAVGQFEIGSFSIPAEMHTGDPLPFKVTVTGRGNFDRVNIPQLQPGDGWKTYGAKSDLEPVDRIGFEARKTFEQPVLALQPGTREMRFSLAYFDPEAGEYRTAESDAVPVQIEGSIIAPNALDDIAQTAAPTSPADTTGALAPLRDDLGRLVPDFTPLSLRPWFLTLQSGVLLAIVGASAFLLVRRAREGNPDAVRRRATAKAVAEQVRRAETARLRQDGPEFFAAARLALQLTLANRWHCNPEAITSEDIAQRLPHDGATARIFGMADAIEFSGAQAHPDSFDDWQQSLTTALDELNQSESIHPTAEPRHWGGVSQAA